MPEPTEHPEPADSRRFFVIWSPQGGPPVVRFPSFETARFAAIRLSNRHPDQDFFVLASCWGRVAKPPVEAIAPETPAPAIEAIS
jgi:hypothetical protein